jgi:hypothetical protein
MKTYQSNKLPTGFRFLFSKKDIKAIEKEKNVHLGVYFGGTDNTTLIEKDQSIGSCFKPVFLTGQNDELGFRISLFLSGFRTELLPKELEEEAKTLVKDCMIECINWLLAFKETDFKRVKAINPELRIAKDQVRIVM